MGKSLRTKILEALEREPLTVFELAKKLGTKTRFLRLTKLEEEGLIHYELGTDKWRLEK